MEIRFDYNLEEPKYPKLEDLVDVKLPEDIKTKVVDLVFKGKLSNPVVQLSAEDFFSARGRNFIQLNMPDFYDVCKSLADYFEKNVMKVLFDKSTELLTPKNVQDDEQKIQDITKWYEEIEKEAKELYKRWLEEVAALTIEHEKLNTPEEPLLM